MSGLWALGETSSSLDSRIARYRTWTVERAIVDGPALLTAGKPLAWSSGRPGQQRLVERGLRPDSALTKAACTAEAASTGTLIGDGDVGATDGLAAFGGGLVAVEGAVADALALHAGRIVRALQLPRQELRADIARHQFLGRHGELDVAAEPFVFVDDEGDGDGDAGVADSAGL